METLESRLVLNSAPVASTDAYSVFYNESFHRSSGLLANDTDADFDRLAVVAFNGQAVNVAQEITLAPGSKVTVEDDGSFVFVAANGHVGNDSFSYTVGDGVARSTASVSFDVVSQPIHLTPTNDQVSADGDAVSVQADIYSGPRGGPLTYFAENLPDGLSIDPTSGLITGTIPAGATTYGTARLVTLSVTDGTSWASDQITWEVTTRVAFGTVADRTDAEGDAVSFSVPATIPGGAPLTYSAGDLPDGLTINASTGVISGTIAPGAARTHHTLVFATDGTYSGVVGFTWTVNSLVAVAAVADQTTTEGASVSLQTSASVPGGGTLTFSATGLPVGLSINSATGLINGTLGANPVAFTSVTVSATNGTYTGKAEFTWYITPHVVITAVADQTDTEADVVSLQIAASSPGASGLTYTADGLPDGLSINASTGLITGTIAPETANQYYDVTVTVDDGTYTADVSFAWYIDPLVVVTPVADRTGTEGDVVSFGVTATGGTSLVYTATNLPAGVSINASTGVISGTLTAPALTAPLPVTVTVTSGTYFTEVTFEWPVASKIAVTTVDTQGSKEGDTISLPIVATVPGGGALTYAATGLPTGLSINATTGVISGTLAVGTASNTGYSVVVTVTQGGSTAQVSFVWSVTTRVSIDYVADQTSAEGATVSLPVTATVPGGGAITYSATGLPSGLSINGTTGVITGTLAANTATQGTPASVTITATSGNYSGSQTFTWTVNSTVVSGGLSAVSDTYLTRPGHRLTVAGSLNGLPNPLENDSATSGGSLSVAGINGGTTLGAPVTLPSGAKVTMFADGGFHYDPPANFTGVDTFTYTVSNALFAAAPPIHVKVEDPLPDLTNLDGAIYLLLKKYPDEMRAMHVRTEMTKKTYYPNHDAEIAAALVILRKYVLHDVLTPGHRPKYAWAFHLNIGDVIKKKDVDAFKDNLSKNQDDAKTLNEEYKRLKAQALKFQVIASTTDTTTNTLWGDDAKPLANKYSKAQRSDQVQQGVVGDCVLMSSLISMTRTREFSTYENWIKLKPGFGVRQYEVTLHHAVDPKDKTGFKGKPHTVTIFEPTAAQRLMDGHAKDGSLWVNLFEKAYLQKIQQDRGGLPPGDPVVVNERYYQYLVYGQRPDEALLRIQPGAHAPLYFVGDAGKLDAQGNLLPMADQKTGLTAAQILKQVQDPKEGLMVAGTRLDKMIIDAGARTAFKDNGLFHSHAYAVLGYNKDDKTIHLRNPHNLDDGKAGSKDVYLSVDHFSKIFWVMASTKWNL